MSADAQTATESGDPVVGSTIAGRYEVLRRLGSGGMGAVYEARHTETGGRVAIKVLSGVEDETAARRFRLEAELAAALRHTNTIRVMDFGADAGRLYLVMELVDGHSVAERLQTDGRFPWPRAVATIRQVLKALWEAHEHPRRIVHRDIKPANIMLADLPGEPDHVRVVDFGIARALDETGLGTRGFIGTPAYIAPELWDGAAADPRSDLYAVGCVMYELLTGSPPFTPPPSASHSLFALIDMHRSNPPPTIADRAPGVPAPISAWVERLLGKTPDARPSSAQAALAELDAAAADAADAPAPSPPGDSADTANQAAPPRSGGTADATGAASLSPPRPSGSNAPAVAAATASPARRPPTWAVATIAALGIAGAAVGALIALASPADTDPVAAAASSPSATAAGDDLGALVFSYRAELSRADRTSQTGERLRRAPAILARDRQRFHAGFRDAGDEPDDRLGTDDARERFERLIALSLDETTAARIADGHPRVEVLVHERGAHVRLR